MGVGLIALQAEKNRRRRAIGAKSHGRSDRPIEAHTPKPVLAQAPNDEAASLASLRQSPGASNYREVWSRLVESDPDLSRLASVLADYGKQYVDELAQEYVATPDKKRLPEIVDGIIRRARRNASPPSILGSPIQPADRSVADDRFVERQSPLPAAGSGFASGPSTITSLAELAKQVASSSAVQKAYTVARELDRPITTNASAKDNDSADIDDDLFNMVSKFAPDSAFLRRKS